MSILSDADLRALLATCAGTDFTAGRDTAIMLFLRRRTAAVGAGRPPGRRRRPARPDRVRGGQGQPARSGVGLSLWRLLEELQVLPGCWVAPAARSATVPHPAGSVTEYKPAQQLDRVLLDTGRNASSP
jgi:hypothetical protein